MNRQDLQGVRTAQDLERKYDFESMKQNSDTSKKNADEITKINNELSNFIDATTKDIDDLQKQVDGSITSWFASGVPTLANYPANEWTTDDLKNEHLGDLYYDQETGYSFRFTFTDNKFEWLKIQDSDVTKALAIANAAQDTADKKRRVFLEQPKPPYDSGDMWVKEGEIWICQISKQEGAFESKDFINELKYTDDTKAEQVGNNLTILSGTVAEIKEGVNEVSTKLTETQKLVDANGKEIGTLAEEYTEVKQTTDSLSTTVKAIGDRGDKTTTITQDLDRIEASISEIADITVTKEGYGLIEFVGINKSEPIKLEIRPYGEDISKIYPRKNLYPSNNLYMPTRRVVFDNKKSKIYYDLPADLLFLNSQVYDSFILDYETKRCYIKKNVGINEDGSKYPLNAIENIPYEYPTIDLEAGDYKIYLESFNSSYILARLMTQNIYTDQFATRVEMNSAINQSATNINLSVDEKIVGLDKKISGDIDVNAGKITAETNAKISGLDKDLNAKIELKVDTNKLVSEINASADDINLTGNRVTIESSNFKLEKDGTVSATNGNFSGKINATSGTFNGTVNATDGVFKGRVEASEGVFNGEVNASSGTFKGRVEASSGIFNGEVNASNGTFKGKVEATSGSFNGSIYSNYGKIGGFNLRSTGLSNNNFSVTNNGAMNLYPQVENGGTYRFNNGVRLNATSGIQITSNGGSPSFPSRDLNLMAQHGANAYMACVWGTGGSERSAVICADGELRLQSAGVIYANGVAIGGSSSKATKKNIKNLTQKEKTELYDLVKNIPLKKYDYKKQWGKKNNYGFIIEDIENTKLNDLLHIVTDKQNKKVKHYCSEDLVRLELVIIQELMKKVECLENKLRKE